MWAKHTHGLVIGTRGDSRRPGGFTGSLTPSKNSSFASVPNSPPRASSSSSKGERSYSYFFGAMSVGSGGNATDHQQVLQGELSGSTDSTPLGSSSRRQSSVVTTAAYSVLQLHFSRIINAKDVRRVGTSTTITQAHYT
eukprot:TRINITY_DN59660_c0_g1_i2.p1 TRINITY_DN59660_c0_g1~~TRINITY_DN59660_c0_g1_i2.p1  ORF type:complete len:139 (+),score=13.20 TRINITY_DN59660_c0_g1_i2:187-603(+)